MALWLEVTNSETGVKELVNMDRVGNIEPQERGGSKLWLADLNDAIGVDEDVADFKAALKAKGKDD